MKRSGSVLLMLSAAVLGVCLVPQPAGAVLKAYDSLAEGLTNSLLLNGATNGFGWAAGWHDQGVNRYGITTNEPLMQYTAGGRTLDTLGGYGIGGGSYCSAGRRLDTGVYWDPNSGQFLEYRKVVVNNWCVIGKEGTNIWMSLLVRSDVNTDEYHADFHAHDIDWQPNAVPRIEVALSGGMWQLKVIDAASATQTVPTGVARTLGTTYLMVFNVKFDAAGDVVDLYVNPDTIGGEPPATPTCSITSVGDVYFQSFYFYPGKDPNNGAVDEIRVGDSFAAVTPFTGRQVFPGPVLILQ
jgi:hypothetical protein